MNRYVIIAIVFVVLMVAFGRNPIESAKKDRENALIGKDPLVEKIKEHNGQGALGAAANMMGGGGIIPDGGGGGMGRPMGTVPNTPGGYSQQAPAPYNSYYPPPPQGAAPSPLQQIPVAQPQPEPQQ